jgi:hypothetical protein
LLISSGEIKSWKKTVEMRQEINIKTLKRPLVVRMYLYHACKLSDGYIKGKLRKQICMREREREREEITCLRSDDEGY